VLLVLKYYTVTHLVIVDVVIMKLDTILTCFTEIAEMKYQLSLYIVQFNISHSPCPRFISLLQWLLALLHLGRLPLRFTLDTYILR
jgi:hypothetical protein